MLPLGCEAAPKPAKAFNSQTALAGFTSASQPSGSKLPRHSFIRKLQRFVHTPYVVHPRTCPCCCHRTNG
ncbi:hypothetical protein C3E98_009245 [Pseudomonas sp. MWU13-2625]|nr:hypothetical protein C3E98_009245 [Pseudomonas sp. MWU13-2625]